MDIADKDLRSIQEVRTLIRAAREAAGLLAGLSQETLDGACAAIARDCMEQAERLAKMAVEETGFGRWRDKVLKNKLGSAMTWESIKAMRVKGILSEDKAAGIREVGVPIGVIAALIPSTNPTSTVMYKALISLKAGNAVVFSPHPGAKGCIMETVRVVARAAERAGIPAGAIGCVSTITPEAVNELLRHRDVGLILATGGEAMVRAAYSSGNPAIGVGPGNGPAFIEKTADIPKAVGRIFDSKTFDNGTICASEQSVVTEEAVASAVERELERQGGYFLSEEESARLGGLLLRADGSMNPAVVGKTAAHLAKSAGISIPAGTKVLLSRQTQVSRGNPYSREKLCPVLGYYVEKDWEAACERCIAILRNEGAGHTMVIHSEDETVIREFSLQKPVSRLLVNTPAALGGVGATTSLPPALTLGCGAVGGSATSDNITPMHLINIRRTAWGIRELAELQDAAPSPEQPRQPDGARAPFTREDIEAIAQEVLDQLSALS